MSGSISPRLYIIFYPITDYLLKRLQRIQFSVASFVFGRYVNNTDSILKLSWLPMKESREWHVLTAARKAIYSHNWPRNLQLEQVRHARNLRSSSTIITFYCLLPSFLQIHNSDLCNFLILLLYQAKSHTMDVLILNRYYYYYYYYYYYINNES